MRTLLIHPEYPDTFWSFSFALKLISKKAAYPPLGLLTVASMLPREWERRLLDMNVRPLGDEDLVWADMVFIGAMAIQKPSVRDVVDRCVRLGKPIVCGGPLFTAEAEAFPEVDHLVLNEAEVTLPRFLHDLARNCAQRVYSSTEMADLSETPIPSWDLIDQADYAAMSIQASRGCPYDCEFCNITSLFGRVPRLKSPGQITAELEQLYRTGWRGGVFFVDDNFIGHKAKVKSDILPAISAWMERRNAPFHFNSQVPINIADDPALMQSMAKAGFTSLFVGIESPNEESLAECNKVPNRNRDLMACVRAIQQSGMEVQAGFIVGFDNDTPSVFDRLIHFIQASGIVTAMVGLLSAMHGTHLYERLKGEHRLLLDATGDNTDSTLNFIPRMPPETLVEGYRRVVERIYSPDAYYQRVKRFLQEYRPRHRHPTRLGISWLLYACRATVKLGILEKERRYYWRLILWSVFRRPRLTAMAVKFSAYGFHFRKIVEQRR